MPKATLTLPNGTIVQVDGTTVEIQHLLDYYGGKATSGSDAPPIPKLHKRKVRSEHRPDRLQHSSKGTGDTVDLAAIVNHVKNCDEAEGIEKHILDRSSQVDRTLLPLYVVHEHMGNASALSSGEISKVATDLGVPVSQPNASRTLSGTAAKYVIGDRVRKKGFPVRYKLSRRGLQYLQAVIKGKQRED